VGAQELKLPGEVKTLRFFSPLEMAIYKPEGNGPFPAVVLLHTCGGLSQHIRDWTKQALGRGYVVFVVDSFGPRGLKGCTPPTTSVERGTKDALDALAHLAKFDVVASGRVGLIGFSWGGDVALYEASQEMGTGSDPAGRCAASVALYPECVTPKGREHLRSRVERPLLVLMGELDNETPAADCVSRLDLKAQGAPVEWHVYPGTTHAWDKAENNGNTKQHVRGFVTYRYRSAAYEDSVRRAFDFLAARLHTGQ
jgi:dienelactone hydrolase